MGLISEISEQEKDVEYVREDVQQNEAQNFWDQQDVKQCEKCDAQIHWQDIYGGGPHCHRCFDWPSESLVASLAVATVDGWVVIWPKART